MRQALLICAALLLLIAPRADAGAWLREQGSGFGSLSFGATLSDETTNSIYLEYGLHPKMTVGLDISTFTNSAGARNGTGVLFMRRSITDPSGPQRLSYELGVGGIFTDDEQLPAVKGLLSWGRGFEYGPGYGWMNVDVSYLYEPQAGRSVAKLDGVLGLPFTAVTTGLFEVTLSEQEGETYGAVLPSLLFSPRFTQFRVKVGAEVPYDDPGERSSLKLGLWREF